MWLIRTQDTEISYQIINNSNLVYNWPIAKNWLELFN